jgi:hypothetical protein
VATIDLANYSLAIAKSGVAWGQRRYDAFNESVPSGNVTTRLFGVPRWTLSLNSPEVLTESQAVVWRELLLALRGRVNYLKAWNPVQTVPRGTMRGTMTLSSTAAAGATSIVITAGAGQASTTLLSGSPLTIGTGIGTSQLVHTIGNATANGSGVITVTVEPPLRQQFVSTTAVTWDKAFTYFKQTGNAARWIHYDSQLQKDFAIDLLEAIN